MLPEAKGWYNKNTWTEQEMIEDAKWKWLQKIRRLSKEFHAQSYVHPMKDGLYWRNIEELVGQYSANGCLPHSSNVS